MLKILWKREEIAPEEQFLVLSTILCYLMLDFCVKTRIRFSLRDKRLFEITEVEITRVDCIYVWSRRAMMLSNFQTDSDYSRTMAYCTCSRWVFLFIFSLAYQFSFSLFLSLGEGPILIKALSKGS